MKKLLLITVINLLYALVAQAQSIEGDWNGVLKVNEKMQLRLVFHITKDGEGYKSTLDSPDQGAKGIPVSATRFADSKLNIEIAAAGIAYAADLKDNKLVGIFKQGGADFPLELQKGNIVAAAPKRPQEPQKPFPYYAEDIVFENAKAQITLAGTLTLPQKEGSFPAVILISGSGAQNRDEELLGHKPFLVISDYLTRNGIAVLRYDDRGVGQSKGNFKAATSADFATDVESAVAYLKTRKEIKQIGLMGHSEGGLIAPMVAANNKNVAFIVLLAGPGLRGDSLLLMQTALIARANGEKEKDIEMAKKVNTKAFKIVENAKTDADLEKELTVFLSEELKGNPDLKPKEMSEKDFIAAQMKMVYSPWMRYFLTYDPAPQLKKVKCPVLALNGENDLQVPAKANLEAIEKWVKSGGNKDVTIKAYPKLNHLFQTSTTGSPAEYPTIEETFSPRVMEDFLTWIKGKVAVK